MPNVCETDGKSIIAEANNRKAKIPIIKFLLIIIPPFPIIYISNTFQIYYIT